MGLSCSMQVLKWATFVFSIVVFLFGLAVVIVGSLATFLLTSTYEQIVQISAAIPISALVIGIIICLCGFLGCFGALRESRGMLYMYSLVVAVLIIAEVVICVVTLTKKTELGAAVESMVNRSFFEQFKDETVRSAFRWMEEELDCCGVNGVSDYWTHHKPNTCEVDSYAVGCAGAFAREFRKFTLVLPVVAIVFGLLQFLAVAGACCLASAIKRQVELV
ncbi:hypothetical protein AAHC03_04538 [Spirometra sp. Aus1]